MMRWIKAVCLALVLCVVISVCGFSGTCEDISRRVVRLHIVAASDSEEDQALKLKVRDAVLAKTSDLFDGVYNTALARQKLDKALFDVESTAKACLAENGCDDPVAVELCRMYFTTRRYESGTLPAGEYEALRVTIGEGKGHNWWCVVFPPMCVGSAEKVNDEILTSAQQTIIENPSSYRVQFKVVEWYKEICRRLDAL